MRRPNLSTAVPEPMPAGDLRTALRSATQDVHESLHHHPGFSALRDGTISLAQYRSLLARLYGFYAPVEAACGLAPTRTQWLSDDLMTLGVGAPHALPRCTDLPRCDTPARRLGVRYVVEGAALGGQQMGRQLDHVLGPQTVPGAAGRRFFTGFGAGTGARWRGFVAELALADGHGAAIAGAQETFGVFECWLLDWGGDGGGGRK